MIDSEGRMIIYTDKAPEAIGPYSQAVRVGNMIFTAGQIGLDPATMEIVSGGIEAETRQVLTNLKEILKSANSGMSNVIKTVVFLRDMADFPKMNNIYAQFFTENPPARSTVEVAGLPKNVAVEIEAIALTGTDHGL
ncbi:MAG: RidA family protein [Anaerolineae bacterium]|nr:RidA family protein [Anaerolineae bacterium]MDK1080644.1 RidA family protein [Anaerolineae bacterium]MDK1117709.1 RidA family protein [Anaerolineae bacterium]